MLTIEEKNQFTEILEGVTKELDITQSQYDAAVASYQAVGRHLSKEDSILAPYKPKILSQGSFMLGTMVKPIKDDDDLDIDLVCELMGKNASWTQYDVKQKIGDQLKSNKIYEDLLDEEGRRCWTLLYREDSDDKKAKYHMDILPSVVDSGYRTILEKAFTSNELEEIDKLAIRITDKEDTTHKSDNNKDTWPKSNPFGYAKWFSNRGTLDFIKGNVRLQESIQEVPQYTNEKTILQRVVQILKRHRDIRYGGEEHKPISIIITTLAAKAYAKESNLVDALINVINKMPQFIIEQHSAEHQKTIKWVENPVNNEENFADKWPEESEKQKVFYAWLSEVKKDMENILKQRGMVAIKESLENPFGKETIRKAFDTYGKGWNTKRESGILKMASNTGMLGTIAGTPVKKHNFYGEE